jgi:hypothetical protein
MWTVDRVDILDFAQGGFGDIYHAIRDKLFGQSQASKDISEMLYKRAKNNVATHLILHSDGAFKGANALKRLRNKYNIDNWSNLETEWHGSPVNYLKAYYRTKRIGGEFWGMENHSLDLVGKVAGTNSLNLPMLGLSISWLWTLFADERQKVGWHGSNHTMYKRIEKKRGFWEGLAREAIK